MGDIFTCNCSFDYPGDTDELETHERDYGVVVDTIP